MYVVSITFPSSSYVYVESVMSVVDFIVSKTGWKSSSCIISAVAHFLVSGIWFSFCMLVPDIVEYWSGNFSPNL